MRSFFTSGAVATLVALAAVSTAWAQDVTPTDTGNSTAKAKAQEVAGAITALGVNFSAYRDPFSNFNWMIVRVDFIAKENPNPSPVNPKWVDGVTVTLTLGWGPPNTSSAEVDLALTAKAKLVSIEVGKRNSVLFFVPPEVLQRGLSVAGSSAAIPLSVQAPTYYVAQFDAGGVPIEPNKQSLSSTLINRAYVDGFLKAAEDKTDATKGWMLNATTVPSFVLYNVVSQGIGGGAMPTVVPDSGH
jgi:hypothetical protein